ncbi:hypothetical protein JTE90_025011 [Oedothorax gibbosus]|uniref:Uncharacterized protein n=1 Tax=Oedothorax gibbosus TaxID=931172 RepID=A0AAV6VU55_9ARAC|nr:hypothetical protein JTE90_025011 [Oedothorax gibbosus]
MGRHKDTDLRRTCLTKNIKQYLDHIKCSNEAFVHQAEVPASSIQLEDHSCSKPEEANQENLEPPENENKFGIHMPTKRYLEQLSQKSQPRRKKLKVMRHTPHTPLRGKPFGEVTKLTQILVSTTQRERPIPDDIMFVYNETLDVLNNIERDMKTFFEIDDHTCIKDGIPAKKPIRTKVTETTVFREIDNFYFRHIYKKFFNSRLLLGRQLREAIEKSNKYMYLLRGTIEILPVCGDYVPNLIDLFNKAFATYQAHPVHKAYRVACRQLVLLKVLLTKFNKKHGLPESSRSLDFIT